MYNNDMKEKQDLYRGMTASKELLYTHAAGVRRALINLEKRCKEKFGTFKLTDLQRQLEDKSWTRVSF